MRASRAEIIIEELLKDSGLRFTMEQTFTGLMSEGKNPKPLRFDFCIFDDDGNIECLIEYNGEQHYKAFGGRFGGKRGFYQQQYNDNKKRRFCKLHGYKLVEIPYTDYNLLNYDYLMNKIYG